VSCGKTAELIDTPLAYGLGWAKESMCWMGSYWRHLANTFEPSVCGGDAALCQITLLLSAELSPHMTCKRSDLVRNSTLICITFSVDDRCLQCFDTVAWAPGRASGL